MTRSNLYQRLFAGLWLLACVGLAVAGWRYQAPFSYEPVGPRAYPLLCLALMGAGLAWLIARPTPIRHADDEQPLGGAVLLKVLACIALLLVFAGLFETLGFILSAALVGSCMAILYGARPIPAVVTASLLGIGLYWLFDRALDVPLPLGVLEVAGLRIHGRRLGCGPPDGLQRPGVLAGPVDRRPVGVLSGQQGALQAAEIAGELPLGGLALPVVARRHALVECSALTDQ